MEKRSDLLIIVPAYNESESIAAVIEELNRVVPQYDYVVVNDGSRDETAAICRKMGVTLLDLPANLGLTGAFQTGMRYAYEQGYQCAVQIDADGQHDPQYIPEMERMMAEKDADLIIASRFVTEKRPLKARMIGSAVLDGAIRLTTGRKINDPTSGMRLYGKRLLSWMAYDLNSSPEPDTVAYLLRCGARVEECQVTMRERTAGESYLSPWRSVRYMSHMCMNILFVQWFRKRRKL